MKYTVLSPWAESSYRNKQPISPRLDSLSGKTIGLYASFKEYHPFFMKEVGRQLTQAFPDVDVSYFTYTVDTQEIEQDEKHIDEFKEWIDSVDAVIGFGADMGSCSLFMGYNFAFIEKLGKPSCLLAKHQYFSSAKQGANSRGIPGLRIVTYDGPGFVPAGVDCNDWCVETYAGTIAQMLPEMAAALTEPLTEEEKNPESPEDFSCYTFTGTLDEINACFYEHGWTNGTPVVPPTREAVDEMLKGTDLPADYVVAELPPMNGKATVEKIAINGVMAGCLPTHMPILIAIAKGMGNHDVIKLEGWTCSNSFWSPVAVVSGPIGKDIALEDGRNLLSGYTLAASAISRALAYMVMNISGCRSQIEDMSGPGSDSRFGICFAENNEESPWDPLHTDYGYQKEDSCVTLFWPRVHFQVRTAGVSDALGSLCKVYDTAFDPGLMVILPPETAELFAKEGYSKQDILDYVKEYNRHPSTEINRIILGNNHQRKGLIPPSKGLVHSAPVFFNTSHMFVVVGGRDWGNAYFGGGDHGGPICVKAELPKDWEELTAKYPGRRPGFVKY